MLNVLPVVVALALAPPTNGNSRAESIAKDSPEAKNAMAYLHESAAQIKDAKIRAFVVDILKNPAPTFMARWKDRAAAKKKLVDAGLLDANVDVAQLFPPMTPLSFAAASGGVPNKHHGNPGGLAVHTAFNLRSARALSTTYREQYAVALDEDLVIAAPILHDAMKAWTLQYNDDGTLLTQAFVAGTSSHHPFIVAEAIERGVPNALVVAVASAHEPPESEGTKVAKFLVAGALLAGKDAVAMGLVVGSGDKVKLAKPTSIEATINHLSDHDYILSDPAYLQVNAALDRVLAKKPGDDVEKRWLKHQVLAKLAGMKLYALYVKDGDEGVAKELARAGL